MDNTSIISNLTSVHYVAPGGPEYLTQTKFVCEQVLMPLVCSIGIVGNVFGLCVLIRKEMIGATNTFITFMTLSDLLLLLLQTPLFFKLNGDVAANLTFKRFFQYYSIIRYAGNNVFITNRSWLTVAVTFERFISLRFMCHPRFVCTVPRARYISITIAVLSFLFHFSKFFEYVPNRDLNSPRPIVPTEMATSSFYDTYVHITNIALAAIIPEFLLVVANSFLIYFLVMHKRRMICHQTIYAAGFSSVDMLHISMMVVATVFVFIACNSVAVFLALNIAHKGRVLVFQNPVYLALNHVNTVLLMTNSGINCILYCIISSKFRKTFLSVAKRHLGCTNHCYSTATTSKVNPSILLEATNSQLNIALSKSTTPSWLMKNVNGVSDTAL